MRHSPVRLLVFAALQLVAAPAEAAHRVSPAVGTIQNAVDAAAAGDTILVSPGTYVENIDFGNKGLVVLSEGGADVTTIDGSASPDSAAIRYGSGVTGAVLRGFTVTGSTGESTILVLGAGVVFEDDVIRDNEAVGIDVRGGTVEIRRSSFLRNDHGNGPTFAGAICVGPIQGVSHGCAIIEQNVFQENRAGFGAALSIGDDSSVQFLNNDVLDNSCSYDGGGVFIGSNLRYGLFEHNRFLRNSAGDHGGAIAAWHAYAGRSLIQYNLIAFNRAEGQDAQGSNGTGGGVHISARGGEFSNNTVVFNESALECGGAGVFVDSPYFYSDWIIERNIIAFNGERGLLLHGEGQTIIRDNLIHGNNVSTVNCQGTSSATLATFENNVDADPQFCGIVHDDFRVASASPALVGHEPWGAFTEPGCTVVAVEPSTWGLLKARWR